MSYINDYNDFMSKKVTMQTIADSLGISKVSVHKALVGQYDISSDLKKKVLEEAEKLGYVYKKDRMIKNHKFLFLTSRKYINSDTEQFYSIIFSTLKNDCKFNKSSLELCYFDSKDDFEILKRKIFEENKITGVFTAGLFEDYIYKLLVTLPLPVVVIDYYAPQFKLNYVYLNSFNDAFNLTLYAVEHGHKKIGYIGPIQNDTLVDRYLGYRKCLFHFGLTHHKNWIISEWIGNGESPFFDFKLDCFDDMPTCFICHCDLSARRLIKKLEERGLKVPEDVSILSFDNTEISCSITPQITSMGIDLKKFADTALQLMRKILSNPNETHSIKLYSQIHVRESFKNI